jgi:ribosomal subunit interface protein
VDIVFIGRHTDVQERFRKQASAKLARIEKLDGRAMRVDVEISIERNPRQSDHKERVELTVSSKGPAIRAEAAAEDRFAALDMAMAKLESRLRRACDRRKRSSRAAIRVTDMPAADRAEEASAMAAMLRAAGAASAGARIEAESDDLVRVEVQGDGPLIVREKFHAAVPMSIDQALFEMELVGHDFFLFTDAATSLPSVVYRRRGYQYGVIRLVAKRAALPQPHEQANGRASTNSQAGRVARQGGRLAGPLAGRGRAQANLSGG